MNAILLTGMLQVKNETCYALGLYYKKSEMDNTGFDHIGELTNPFEESYKFGIVEPDEVYNIPIVIAYHCSIYILPIFEE